MKGIEAPARFASYALVLTDWVDTTNFIAVGGRGVAKSTVILARRSERCVRLMPGAPVAIVANTYSNLVDNIMPAVQNGWRIDGLVEGIHYVKGRRPPDEWRRRCSVIVDDYRHVYSFWNGSVLFLGSLDNPSLLAGKSVAHLLFDEAKYASAQRAARVMPILRGDAIRYGHCHLYGGVTVTTDMPDVMEGEHDWFFRYASEMDPQRVVAIVQAAGELNRLRIALERENRRDTPDTSRLARIGRKIDYYTRGLHKMRKGQTFFINMSSLVNIDVLTVDYLRRLYDGGLERHEFLKSVFGMRPGVRESSRFYVLFSSAHKYDDGTISGEAAFISTELRRLDPDRPLDGGMDFGNMLSLVIAQDDGKDYRIHKNIYELPPRWYRELADRFLDFFSGHRCRVLNLYYDRSGNSFQRQGEDSARRIKDALEYDAEGRRTGWEVNLMSRRQGVIYQHQEYEFMQELLSGRNPRLPRLLVDSVNCPELVSSIEGARAAVKFKGERKIMVKVKKSEKLEPKKLPKLSTNFSDAFKYLMMRRQWMSASKVSAQPKVGSAADVDEFLDRYMD